MKLFAWNRRFLGLTLVESIIAIFLLTTGFLVVSRCFHSALQISANVNTRALAVAVAERHLETAKAYSRAYHFPRGSDSMGSWHPMFSTTYRPDDYDGRFQVATYITAPDFYSPCTRFEQIMMGAPAAGTLETPRTPTLMPDVRRQVTAVVVWGGTDSVRLTTMICAPSPNLAYDRRSLPVCTNLEALSSQHPAVSPKSTPELSLNRCALNLFFLITQAAGESITLPFTVSPSAPKTFTLSASGILAGSSLHHDGQVRITTRLTAPGGGVVYPRCHFVVRGSGTGTIIPDRDGRAATFIHYYEENGLVGYADDTKVTIEATTTFAGRLYRAVTNEVSLVP